MTEDNIRFHAHRALIAIDWLDTHIAARRSTDAKQVEKYIAEARQNLYKLVGTSVALDYPSTSS